MFCWLRSIPTPPALVSHPVICTVSVSAAGAFGLYKREWNRIAVSILWQTPQYGARVHEAILGRAEPSQSEHGVKSVGRCYRGTLRPDLQQQFLGEVMLYSTSRVKRRCKSPPREAPSHADDHFLQVCSPLRFKTRPGAASVTPSLLHWVCHLVGFATGRMPG